MTTHEPEPEPPTSEIHLQLSDTQSNEQVPVPATVPGESQSGAQELVRLYNSADYRVRELLLRSSRSIVNLPSHRAHVSQHGLPQPKFRLMDLPIELRLWIAEYALAQDAPLRWHWTTNQSNKKVGSFQGIDELTALSRVSRQIYSETLTIVWKVNTVAFQGSYFGKAFHTSTLGLIYYMQTVRKMINVSRTYRFFIRQIPFTTRRSLKTIVFNVSLLPITDELSFHLQVISGLARLTPCARIVVQATDWKVHRVALPGLKTMRTACQAHLIEYLNTGYHLDFSIELFVATGAPRNWTIFPSCDGDYSVLKECLEGDKLTRALRWHTHGI